MNKSYVELLKELAHAVEITAEQAMEYNQKTNNAKGMETAEIMRDKYAELYDKMRDENLDVFTLTRTDFINLLVGTVIISERIEQEIKQKKIALNGYKDTLIPKLQKIIESKEEKDLNTLIKNFFEITE